MQLREALQRIAAIENKPDGGDWDEIGEARLIARGALASAPAADPYREHLADQADAIDLERLAKALTVMGCAGPAGQEDCGARIAEMVNRLTSAVERFGRDFRASHPQAQRAAITDQNRDMTEDLFELWWADYMPEATREHAWAAYSAALRPARAEEQEPQPIVSNQKAPGDLKAGDYVFASRWSDCDPGDPWIVGWVAETGIYEDSSVYPGYVRVEGSARRWVHAMRITEDQGRRICEQFPGMELRPQDYQAIARVFGVEIPPPEQEDQR